MTDKYLQRLKLRMPSIKGFSKFWNPTQCYMCYWWRLALAIIAGGMVGWVLFIPFFIIGLYYGLRERKNEHKSS